MAADVSVKKVDEIKAYSSFLLKFVESQTRNCNAMSDLMAQKLQELISQQRRAQSIQRHCEEELQEFQNYYSSVAGRNDTYNLRELQDKMHELQNRKQQADNCCREIDSQINVARNAIMTIIDRTKEFQNKVRDNVDKGRHFLKNSVTQLEQYSEQKKKV